ncbi:hypothetical protein [Flexivirga caeni]|uniref:hypothetical protein n=1 Tax=Flexivirga caeni TaxID=2294115 RepID=UPI0011CD8157|nr:hypothetical protein [Flexivirga caeni]
MTVPTSLSTSDAEWLSLVKYQLLVAQQQSQLVTPLNALALSAAQDSVESVLALVVQAKGGDLKARADFLQIFDAAVAHGQDADELRKHRPAIAAMNTARVSFKHHGNVPEASAIVRHVDRAKSLVQELVDQVFDISLDDVSLLLFLRSEEAQKLLSEAQTLWNSEKADEAMEKLRLAFDVITKDFTGRKSWYPGKSVFTTKPSFYPTGRDIKQWGKVAEKFDEWLQNLDGWVRYSALGVNMIEYAYFNVHAPSASYAIGGNAFLNKHEGVTYNEEVFVRCFKFVVDTGISLARSDFDFDAWAARQAATSDISDI